MKIRVDVELVYAVALVALLGLASCGGGGGGGAPAPAPTPAAPTGVAATARDGNNLISWTAVSGATSYNVYWSTTTGVTKATGTKIAFANNPWAHTGLANGTAYYYIVTTVSAEGESVESAQVTAMPAAAANVADPLYTDQWHLKNTGQAGGTAGQDVNVEMVWATYKGTGVRIAVVDDGLEIGHEDLASNIAATGLSYNYLNGGSDPTEDPADTTPGNGHGTAVAGIAASRDLNGLGGRGAAPRANMVGYNLLQSSISTNEADAMTRGSPNVHISSNSWGAPDDRGTLAASNLAWRTAISTGLVNGRGGRGTVYTWAAGNGGATVDNSNYDGQANNRGVIAICAVGDDGMKANYSERGANLWVCTPSMGRANHGITTADRTGTLGYNITGAAPDYANTNYTNTFSGTSSATPLASGVIALMLEAKPTLGWRDVRLILAQSARKNDPTDPGWTLSTTTPAYNFNHKYGFGVIDAAAAVTLASTWTNVGTEVTFTTALASPGLAIPDNNATGVSNTINVVGSGIANIEFIEITFSAANHPYSGDLEVTLTSPAGTVSRLAETHLCLDANQNVLATCPTPYNGWVFGSARHLGEAADGNWILTVKDLGPADIGTFQSWGLKFYGR